MSELLRKYTNEDSKFLVINDALVHYREEGKGPPLLLIHGAFSSLHTFDGWVDELKDEFSIIRVDLPGFGLSNVAANQTYSLTTFVEFIGIFMERMGLDSAHIAGNSLGGWIAWEYALLHPQRVDKLVLISSAGFLDDKSIPLPFKMARLPFAGKMAKLVVARSMFSYFLSQVYHDNSLITQELTDRYYDMFSREGNLEAFIALVNTRYKDNTPKLKKLTTPTLIMWGQEDKWVPLENGYQFQKFIPNSELVIYEALGHIPMEEAPSLTSLDLYAFLSASVPVST